MMAGMRRWARWLAGGLLGIAVLATAQRRRASPSHSADWPEYGGNAAGQRYSAARQITPSNVANLRVAWTVPVREYEGPHPSGTFEATPVLWRDTLYFDTPVDVVLAVNGATGKVLWSFDPKVVPKQWHITTSRGVALWHSPGAASAVCHDRVFVATLDRRLLALDARNGHPCSGFGRDGVVNLAKDVYAPDPAMLQYTSPPVVVGDRVILGSSVADNQTTNAPSGAVRAFDARTGKQLWSWEPLPWAAARKPPHTSGSGNAWAPLAADPEHDLVFVPTGSPSVDYYGGTRVGDNRDADSIVALRASTGEKVWAFQLVHHDLWDYDTASQPLLFTWRGSVPAVAITNKTGMIYVFNRLTGQPLFPIEERKVPPSTVPGEIAWPTQPYSSVQPLVPMQFSVDQMPPSDKADEAFCRHLMPQLDYRGPFTPPSLKGTVIYPAALGGPNWGSSALDPATGIMYTRVNSMAYLVWLHNQWRSKPAKIVRYFWEKDAPYWMGGKPGMEDIQSDELHPPDAGGSDEDWSVLKGTPYQMHLSALTSRRGVPCGGAPYGRLVATDLKTGKQLWSVPNGKMRNDFQGSLGASGPIVTASSLLLLAASADQYLRAYDVPNGRELWKTRLPAPGTGTPMSYMVNGRQYVVVAVGKGANGADQLVAFALAR